METTDQTLRPGLQVGKYVVAEILGAGGFGVTYRARDEVLGLDVALKEYLPAELASRGSSDRTVRPHQSRVDDYRFGLEKFLEEARSLALFRHPNIVRVTDFISENGTAYLVMEYEPGETLGDYLKRIRFTGGMRESEIRALLNSLLNGLEAVHAQGLLHRDIKPDNIYLRSMGTREPMLIDFGSARYALGEHSRSISAVVSMGFAPPEQYTSRGSSQGPWTDLYALGATLYVLVRGQSPVEAPERVRHVVDSEPDPLTPFTAAERGRYSAELLAAIEACLQVSGKSRPQSVTQLRGLLGLLPQPAGTKLVDPGQRFGAEAKTASPSPGAAVANGPAEPANPTHTKPVDPASRFGGQPEPATSTGSATAAPPVTVEPTKLSRGWAIAIGITLAAGAAGLNVLRPWKPADNGAAAVSAEPGGPSGQPPLTADASVPPTATRHRPGKPFHDVLKSGAQGPEMVVIPAGRFLMGSPATEKDRNGDEGPPREVSIRSFAMGTTEVTFADYDRCTAAGRCEKADDSGWGRGTRPVIHVSWEDARKYAAWLSAETGKKYRLPTEAEWEYAARSGTKTAYWWGNTISHENANYGKDDCCGGTAQGRDQWQDTAPVKSFEKNAFGLYDTAGNVWEWVQECYEDSYQGALGNGSAVDVPNCESRVLRGGASPNPPALLRSASRQWNSPVDRDISTGFRLAEDL